MPAPSPQKQFDAFLAKYSPAMASAAKASIAKMRALVPGAVELVYDNYNALVIGFGPTDRATDAVVSLAVYPRWVTLFFLNGKSLHDPKKVLRGSGARVRQIRLEGPGDLDRREVRALVKLAISGAEPPIDESARRRMVIKSISKKQRPRRPAA